MSLLKDQYLEEVNKRIIDSTIKKCSKFYNVRILEAIKIRWLKIYEQKLKNMNSSMDNTNENIEDKNKNQTNNDFDEDEFEDAEVDEKQIADFSDHEDENDEELNDLDDVSISDLSDVDPPTNNVIVAISEKISKPCGRRNANNNWKIKLKGGLMKVDGKEMFFRSLQGDLEF